MIANNTIGYLLFLPIIGFITFRVGWIFYKNGEHYLIDMLGDNKEVVQAINKLLLVGYYLVNMGYAAVTITFWTDITSWGVLVGELSEKLGILILLLGLMHYNNLFWTKYLSKNKFKTIFQ